MKKLKYGCILLTLTVGLGLFTGCGGTKPVSDKNVDGDTGGCYVESEVELPDIGEDREVGCFYKDDSVKLYVQNTDNTDENPQYFSYELKDGQWSEAKEETGLETLEKEQQLLSDTISLGKDGNIYALCFPKDGSSLSVGNYIAKENAEDGSFSDVTPEAVKKADSDGYSAMIPDLEVSEDGTLLVYNGSTERIEAYQNGENVFETSAVQMYVNRQEAVALSDTGKTMAVLTEDGKKVQFFDSSDFSDQGKTTLKEDSSGCRLIGGKDGTWYCLNKKGIQRFQTAGETVETIMDGAYGKMSNEEFEVQSFFEAGQGEFYVLYSKNGKKVLCHYGFDSEVSGSADTTITVFSLNENKTVEQAVSYFQNQNPDIRVDYSYAAGTKETVTQDQIRSLNTQLLNGQGADVLILDGMPMDSYMDKGILMDLSDLKPEFESKGVLLDVVQNTAKKDGKIYALPAKIGMPIVYGNKNAIKALDSIEALDAYLKKNPDDRFFNFPFHDVSATALIAIMQDELIQDNTVDETKLETLISDWMQICDNAGSKKVEKKWKYTGDSSLSQQYFYSGASPVYDEEHVQIYEYQGLMTTMYINAVLKEAGKEAKSYKNIYVPYTIAGINQNSKQKESAQQFLLALYSDEVQQSDTYDGFSVTENGLNYMVEYVNSSEAKNMDVGSSTEDPATGERLEFRYGYPDEETIQHYIDMIHNLNKPYLPNSVVLNTLQTEMENCYEGKETASEAAKMASQKISTYLSE